jgi:hypothetical protein
LKILEDFSPLKRSRAVVGAVKIPVQRFAIRNYVRIAFIQSHIKTFCSLTSFLKSRIRTGVL